MTYSRRSLLRDTALLSIGAAVQPNLLAATQKGQVHPRLPPGTQAARVFFAGSWLFCGVSGQPGFMYAIARDMDAMGHPHIFPYGIWNGPYPATGPFDRTALQLPSSYSAGVVTEYTIDIGGFTPDSDPRALYGVFKGAQIRAPFTYIDNNVPKLKLNKSLDGIRVVRLPIPNRIHATAILTQASIKAADTTWLKIGTPNLSNQFKPGVPVTHILDYDGATGINFVGDSQQQPVKQPISDTEVFDFHIHTAIKDRNDILDHGPEMFQHLMEVLSVGSKPLSSSDIVMSSADPTSIDAGLDLPNGVTEEEIEMYAAAGASTQKQRLTLAKTLASCSGGGIGVDPLPDPCC